jgi:uncharacterized protein (UPF0335 family)
MSKPGHNSKVKAGPIAGERLKSFVERIERLEEERKAIGDDIRDIYTEAKGVGYDVKTVRWVVQERRVDAADRAERDTLRDVYQHALDTAVGLVRGGLSLREAGRITGTSKSSIHRALAVPEVSQPAPHDAECVITDADIPAPRGGSLPWAPEAAEVSAPAAAPTSQNGGVEAGTHSADDMPDQPPFLRRGAA